MYYSDHIVHKAAKALAEHKPEALTPFYRQFVDNALCHAADYNFTRNCSVSDTIGCMMFALNEDNFDWKDADLLFMRDFITSVQNDKPLIVDAEIPFQCEDAASYLYHYVTAFPPDESPETLLFIAETCEQFQRLEFISLDEAAEVKRSWEESLAS